MSTESNQAYMNPCNTTDPDHILSVDYIPFRIFNVLYRAGLTSISDLMEKTDCELLEIRNLGKKALEEINRLFPNRGKTYDGEAELLEARRKWRKLDNVARRIMRFQYNNNMTLAEFMASDMTVEGRSRARSVLTEYCIVFPERIDDVMRHFETMKDTSDSLYVLIKVARYMKQALARGLTEGE